MKKRNWTNKTKTIVGSTLLISSIAACSISAFSLQSSHFSLEQRQERVRTGGQDQPQNVGSPVFSKNLSTSSALENSQFIFVVDDANNGNHFSDPSKGYWEFSYDSTKPNGQTFRQQLEAYSNYYENIKANLETIKTATGAAEDNPGYLAFKDFCDLISKPEVVLEPNNNSSTNQSRNIIANQSKGTLVDLEYWKHVSSLEGGDAIFEKQYGEEYRALKALLNEKAKLIPQWMNQMSGVNIAKSGNDPVRLTLTGYSSLENNEKSQYKINLLKNSSNLNYKELINVGQTVGTKNYTTYVKIAEINAASSSKIEFNFSITKAGESQPRPEPISIYVEPSKMFDTKNKDEFPVFGRWLLNDNNNYLSQVNQSQLDTYDKSITSFVFIKTPQTADTLAKVELVVRLADGEKISDLIIKTGGGAVDKFGILEIQTLTTKPLIPPNNPAARIAQIVDTIQLYFNFISISKNDKISGSQTKSQIEIQYDVGKDVSFDLGVFYKSKKLGGQYESLKKVVDAAATSSALNINFGIDSSGKPNNIANTKIDFYLDFLIDVLDSNDNLVGETIKENPRLLNVSQTTKSILNATPTNPLIFNQTISFNGDYIQLARNAGQIFKIPPKDTKMSLSISKIDPRLLSEPIFYKYNKDLVFDRPNTQIATGQEVVSNELKVVSELAKIYEKWVKNQTSDTFVASAYDAKLNSTNITNVKFNSDTLSDISIDYVGIKALTDINGENTSLTGNQIYTICKDYYKNLRAIVSNTSSLDIENSPFKQESVFEIVGSNSAMSIVMYLLNSSNSKDKIVELVSRKIGDQTEIDSTLEKEIASVLANLMATAYSRISTDFDLQSKAYVLGIIKEFIDDNSAREQQVVNASAIKYDSKNKLFSFVDGQETVTTKTVTNKEMLAKLFELLYLGSNIADSKSINNSLLGRAIFTGPALNEANQENFRILTKFLKNDQRDALFLNSLQLGSPDEINDLFKFYDILFSSFGNPLNLATDSFSLEKLISKSYKNGTKITIGWDLKKDNSNESLFKANDFREVFSAIHQLLDNSKKWKFLSLAGVRIQEESYIKVIVGAANLYSIIDHLYQDETKSKKILVSDNLKHYISANTTSFLNGKNLYAVNQGLNNLTYLKYDSLNSFMNALTDEKEALKIKEAFSWDVLSETLNIINRYGSESVSYFKVVEQIGPILVSLFALGILVVSSLVLVKGGQKTMSKYSKAFLISLIIMSLVALAFGAILTVSAFSSITIF